MEVQSRQTPNSNTYLPRLLALAAIGIVAITGCKGTTNEATTTSSCATVEITPNTAITTTSEAVNAVLNKVPGDQNGAAYSFEKFFGEQPAGAVFTACPVGNSGEISMTMESSSTLKVTVDSNGNYTDLTS